MTCPNKVTTKLQDKLTNHNKLSERQKRIIITVMNNYNYDGYIIVWRRSLIRKKTTQLRVDTCMSPTAGLEGALLHS